MPLCNASGYGAVPSGVDVVVVVKGGVPFNIVY